MESSQRQSNLLSFHVKLCGLGMTYDGKIEKKMKFCVLRSAYVIIIYANSIQNYGENFFHPIQSK